MSKCNINSPLFSISQGLVTWCIVRRGFRLLGPAVSVGLKQQNQKQDCGCTRAKMPQDIVFVPKLFNMYPNACSRSSTTVNYRVRLFTIWKQSTVLNR